jgi:hypothetical protein
MTVVPAAILSAQSHAGRVRGAVAKPWTASGWWHRPERAEEAQATGIEVFRCEHAGVDLAASVRRGDRCRSSTRAGTAAMGPMGTARTGAVACDLPAPRRGCGSALMKRVSYTVSSGHHLAYLAKRAARAAKTP